MKFPDWPAKVRDDGKAFVIEPQYRASFERFMLAKKGERISLVIKPWFKQRSLAQNRFWHPCVVDAYLERCGYNSWEHDAVHDELLRKLVGLRPDCHPALQIRVSSRDLSTEQFNKLIEDAQILAATELGLVIPDPSPTWERED